MLYKDILRLEGRIINLDKHFNLASKDVDEIKISAKKASRRVVNLERLEFDELTQAESKGKSDSAEFKKLVDDESSSKIKLI